MDTLIEVTLIPSSALLCCYKMIIVKIYIDSLFVRLAGKVDCSIQDSEDISTYIVIQYNLSSLKDQRYS